MEDIMIGVDLAKNVFQCNLDGPAGQFLGYCSLSLRAS